jgi:hypothetical protein
MRAAAVALVLIVGAAVVLWFGNMVNSWVLGGLMGGLAAILLSIPISLTLFSFFARHHDQQYGAVEPEMEVMSLAQFYEYEDMEEEENQPMFVEVMEEDGYELSPQRERYEDRNSRREPVSQKLPTPNYLRLPAAGQSHASAQADSALYRRASMQLPISRQQAKVPPERRTYNSGKSVYQGKATRSLHQSEALRVARQEAAQRQEDEEDFPTTAYDLRRMPSDQSLGGRTSRQLPRQRGYQNRRMVVDSTSAQPRLPGTRSQAGGPRTEPINRGRSYPQTGQIRHEKQTGRIIRDLQWDEEYFDPEVSTGSLRNPLVRRAPYMYEDDPLRQELAQQVDRPIRRRSSRYEEEE